MKALIHCPKCGRILGDTEHSFDAININCHGCRKTVRIGVKFAETDKLLKGIYKEKYGNKSK